VVALNKPPATFLGSAAAWPQFRSRLSGTQGSGRCDACFRAVRHRWVSRLRTRRSPRSRPDGGEPTWDIAFGSDLTPDGNFPRHYPIRRVAARFDPRYNFTDSLEGYLGLWRERCRTAPRPRLPSSGVSAADTFDPAAAAHGKLNPQAAEILFKGPGDSVPRGFVNHSIALSMSTDFLRSGSGDVKYPSEGARSPPNHCPLKIASGSCSTEKTYHSSRMRMRPGSMTEKCLASRRAP
jgi:hypothetical protein